MLIAKNMFCSQILLLLVVMVINDCCCASQLVSTAIVSPSTIVDNGHTRADGFGQSNRFYADSVFSHFGYPQSSSSSIIASLPNDDVKQYQTYGKNAAKLNTATNNNRRQNSRLISLSNTQQMPFKINSKYDGSEYELPTTSQINAGQIFSTHKQPVVSHVVHISRRPVLLKSTIKINTANNSSQLNNNNNNSWKIVTVKPIKENNTIVQTTTTSTLQIGKISSQLQTKQPQQQSQQSMQAKQNTHHVFQPKQKDKAVAKTVAEDFRQELSKQIQVSNQKELSQEVQYSHSEKDKLSSDESQDGYHYQYYTPSSVHINTQSTDEQTDMYSLNKDYGYYSMNADDNVEKLLDSSDHLYGQTDKPDYNPPSNIDDKIYLKSLLLRFVKHLDALKAVAEQELNKADALPEDNHQNDDYSSVVIQPTIADSIGNAMSYADHQNYRSLEQSSNNYNGNTFKDSNDRYEGATFVKPCPKSRNTGAHHYH